MRRKAGKRKLSRTDKILRVVALIMPCIVLIGYFFSAFQIRRIENGILDVCATQQDAYVDLVLAQIDLRENRDNEEIINDILSTLDSSANKYWIFSEGQTMLFVKDVLETNKYKGVTAATYYAENGASQFLEGLQMNRVTHDTIQVDGRDYIASGVNFEYRGTTYSLCLLTNRTVLLDNNHFLGAKSELWVILFTALGLLLVLPMWLAIELNSQQKELNRVQKQIEVLNQNLEAANQRLSHQDLFDAQNNLWAEAALPSFADRLAKRGEKRVAFARISGTDQEARQHFLSLAQRFLDRRILRFAAGDTGVILLFAGELSEKALQSVAPLLGAVVQLERIVEVGTAAAPDVPTALALIQGDLKSPKTDREGTALWQSGSTVSTG